MTTWDEKTSEKFADLERLLQDKANTLGDDGDLVSEPFRRIPNAILGEMWQYKPTADNGLVAPDYDSYGVEGSVGTRLETIRLHSYLPSGVTGANSVQTFFTVSSDPAGHGQDDIDAVRRKNLISPTFSPDKANAAAHDSNVRGFELALYPAISNGGLGSSLIADISNGPISVSADPGAVSGLGENFWSVDYMSGIVRFSVPPLNGPTGVMNPNDVFGDINGFESEDAYGTITMFATYYQYSGPFGQLDENNFVVVGDGYISSGTYEGTNQNPVQSAINSLPAEGGTVFIKEGNYSYTAPVVIPAHINIVGLGGAKIARPNDDSAFVISDGYVSIEGLEINLPSPPPFGSQPATIEFRNTHAGQETIRNVNIKNNIIYAVASNCLGIAFVPTYDQDYSNINITNNSFRKLDKTAPIFIGEGPSGSTAYATISEMHIDNNSFQEYDSIGIANICVEITGLVIIYMSECSISNNDGYASDLLLGDGEVIEVRNLTISNNKLREIYIDCDTNIHGINIFGNTLARRLYLRASAGTLSYANVSNNSTGNFGDLYVYASKIITNAVVSNNIVSGELLFYNDMDNSVIEHNIVNGPGTSIIPSIRNSIINGNIFYSGSLKLGNATSDALVNVVFSNNTVKQNLTIGNVAAVATTRNVYLSTISHNTIGHNLVVYGEILQSSFESNFMEWVDLSSTATFDQVGYSKISNNTFISVSFLENVYNSAISGNSSFGLVLSGMVTGCNITGNNITASTRIGRIDTSSISDGYFTGLFNIGYGIVSGTCASNSVISNNVFSNTIGIGDDLASGTAFYKTTFSGNIVRGTTTAGANMTGLTPSNIVFDNSVFSENEFSDAVTFAGGGRAVSLTTHKDSIFNGNKFHSTLSVNGQTDGCIFSNSHFNTAVTFDDIIRTSLSGNGFKTTLVINKADTSKITGNNIGANFTVTTTSDVSTISNNVVDGDLTFYGQIQESIISDNVITGTFDAGIIHKCNLVGNKVATSNIAQSTSLHISDGYISADSPNNITIGSGLVTTTNRVSGTGGPSFGNTGANITGGISENDPLVTGGIGALITGGSTYNGINNAVGGVGLDVVGGSTTSSITLGTGGTGITVLGGTGDSGGDGGIGIEATGGSGSVAVEATGGPGAPGIESTGGLNSTGIKGTGGATNGKGVEGIGTGSGSGVYGSGGGNSGAGVKGEGLAAAITDYGVHGVGGNNAPGVYGEGGSAGATGVHGKCTGSQYGVYGETVSGSGVRGSGGSTGDGVVGIGGATKAGGKFIGSTGPGVTADSTSGVGLITTGNATSAAIRLTPQGLPTSGAAGDIIVDSLSGKASLYNGVEWDGIVSRSHVNSGGTASSTSDELLGTSYMIPQDVLRLGSTIRVRIFVEATTANASDTAFLQVLFHTNNNPTGGDTVGVLAGAGTTALADKAMLDVLGTVTAVGGAGVATMAWMGSKQILGGTIFSNLITIGTNFDEGANMYIKIRSNWDTSGSTLTLHSFVVDITDPPA